MLTLKSLSNGRSQCRQWVGNRHCRPAPSVKMPLVFDDSTNLAESLFVTPRIAVSVHMSDHTQRAGLGRTPLHDQTY
jgi:hypothetical protein